jgi:hypothetical protein
MGLPARTFATVTERDIDLLILEELASSTQFRSWWLKQSRIRNPDEHSLVGAWHSYPTQTGQSDVLLVVENAVGKRYALMIEDKIYAPPQPRQAERHLSVEKQANMKDSGTDIGRASLQRRRTSTQHLRLICTASRYLTSPFVSGLPPRPDPPVPATKRRC